MKDVLTVGEVAKRSGVATSALRFYEDRGLIRSERNAAGHRRYARSVIRRVRHPPTSTHMVDTGFSAGVKHSAPFAFVNNHCDTSSPPGLCEHERGNGHGLNDRRSVMRPRPEPRLAGAYGYEGVVRSEAHVIAEVLRAPRASPELCRSRPTLVGAILATSTCFWR